MPATRRQPRRPHSRTAPARPDPESPGSAGHFSTTPERGMGVLEPAFAHVGENLVPKEAYTVRTATPVCERSSRPPSESHLRRQVGPLPTAACLPRRRRAARRFPAFLSSLLLRQLPPLSWKKVRHKTTNGGAVSSRPTTAACRSLARSGRSRSAPPDTLQQAFVADQRARRRRPHWLAGGLRAIVAAAAALGDAVWVPGEPVTFPAFVSPSCEESSQLGVLAVVGGDEELVFGLEDGVSADGE